MRIFYILIMFCLVGCKPAPTHAKLLQDPYELQRVFLQCDANEKLDPAYCLMVKRTHEDFVSFMELYETNQDQYGQLIVQAEQESSRLFAKMQSLSKQSNEYADAKDAYLQQQEKVATLLAVVNASFLDIEDR